MYASIPERAETVPKTKRLRVELVGGPFDGAVRELVVESSINSVRYTIPDRRDPRRTHAYSGVILHGSSGRIEYLGPEPSEAAYA